MCSLKEKINQRSLKIVAFLAMQLGASCLCLHAYAATSTSDMNVTANINANCTMSNNDLDFGDYDATGLNITEDLTTTAIISTTCTSGTTGVVTMSGGSHFTYCINLKCHRRMANIEETSYLNYNIYTNESYSWGSVWSENPSRISEVSHVIGSGVSKDLTVYGEIPKNQPYASAGSYSDTITITLTY